MDYRYGGKNKKAISSIIEHKVDEFVKELSVIANKKDDEDFKLKVKDSIIVSGGCIASMLLGEEVSDYDFYFSSKGVAREVAAIYVDKIKTNNDRVGKIEINDTDRGVSIMIKSAGFASDEGEELESYQYFESLSPQELSKYFKKIDQNKVKDYHAKFISSNAITLSGGVQLILRFVGDVNYVHETFDYVHAKNYWTNSTGLMLNQSALESILSKQLKYSGSLYPLCSLFRIRKFLKRNWTISAGEIIKIAFDIQKYDLSDITVLQDQISGVDVAYCQELISLLTERQKEGKEVDQTYIVEMIERIFG